MSELLAEIRKIPPVTRFICASTVVVTLPVMAKIISPYTMIFDREFVTQRREVRLSTHCSYTLQLILSSYVQFWRIYTSFFLGGAFL
jgi:Derlin-2/3